MGLGVEGVVNRRVDGEESLSRHLGLEPLHFPFPSSDRKMRVFDSVVFAQAAGAVRVDQMKLLQRRDVGAEPIGGD
jgi:hypothetical protein